MISSRTFGAGVCDALKHFLNMVMTAAAVAGLGRLLLQIEMLKRWIGFWVSVWA